MQELVDRNGKDLMNAFPQSIEILKKSVSLPISIFMVENFQEKIKKALRSVISS